MSSLFLLGTGGFALAPELMLGMGLSTTGHVGLNPAVLAGGVHVTARSWLGASLRADLSLGATGVAAAARGEAVLTVAQGPEDLSLGLTAGGGARWEGALAPEASLGVRAARPLRGRWLTQLETRLLVHPTRTGGDPELQVLLGVRQRSEGTLPAPEAVVEVEERAQEVAVAAEPAVELGAEPEVDVATEEPAPEVEVGAEEPTPEVEVVPEDATPEVEVTPEPEIVAEVAPEPEPEVVAEAAPEPAPPAEPSPETPAELARPESTFWQQLPDEDDATRIWVPHPVCAWVRPSETALLEGLAPDQPLRVESPGYLPVTLTAGTTGELALAPAPRQGSLVLKASPGDHVRVSGQTVLLNDRGLAVVTLAEGDERVVVIGGGRVERHDLGIFDGHGIWVRAGEPSARRIAFATGRSDLGPRARSDLADLVDTRGDWRLSVQGSHSPEGDAVANVALAEARADAVIAALIAAGVPPERVVRLPASPPEEGLSRAEQRAAVVRPLPPEATP